MASLAQLLACHRRILVLDAASTRVQAGLLRAGEAPLWHAADDEAGKAVFAGTSTLLTRTGLALDDIDAFAYCEGPGSMLGIRTVAMTLRTWITLRVRPAYAYQSLAVAAAGAHALQARACSVIADARRESWHCQPITADGLLGPLLRLPAGTQPSGELLTPENFRAWAALPAGTVPCTYDLATLFPLVEQRDLFRETPAPDAHQHEAPDYRKWSAQVHSAETTARP